MYELMRSFRSGAREAFPLAYRLYCRLGLAKNLTLLKLAGVRQINYADRQMYVNRRDRHQRLRPDITNELDLPVEVRLWREVTLRRPSICFDIGAHYGNFTLSGHYSPNTACYSFEPNPYSSVCLLRSVHAHPDQSSIMVYQYAVSEHVGEVSLNVDTAKLATSSLHSSPRFYGPVNEIQVQAITLDDFCAQNSLVPDGLVLIKTDTEGHDYRVLRGGLDFLSKAEELFGIAEFLPHLLEAAGTFPGEFLDFLLDRFEVWILEESPMRIVRLSQALLSNTSTLSGSGGLIYTNIQGFAQEIARSLRIEVMDT